MPSLCIQHVHMLFVLKQASARLFLQVSSQLPAETSEEEWRFVRWRQLYEETAD